MPAEDYLYDVYLSCAGKRVYRGLAYNLYHKLTKEGFRVFLDEVQIGMGEDINEKINIAIYKSRLFVPIFSSEYTTSVDTLSQLEKIRYHCRAGKRTMFPIYMDDLDRTDVITFAKFFGEDERHSFLREQKRRACEEALTEALTEAAGIRGLSLNDFSTEAEFIDEVVEVIKKKLNPTVPVVSSSWSWNIFPLLRWSGSSEVGYGQARGLVGEGLKL